ncbi:TPA: hypothetical protein ACF32X_001147 [Streptococcus pyogenes]|nr:hypothetical protein [Streptococcus pyogenes]
MKNNFWLWLTTTLIGFIIGMMFTCSSVNKENVQLKQRNEGLHKQITHTQKQLKRASEDIARQTKRIAELTGNGG